VHHGRLGRGGCVRLDLRAVVAPRVTITATCVEIHNIKWTHKLPAGDVERFEFDRPGGRAVAMLRGGRELRCSGVVQSLLPRPAPDTGPGEMLVQEMNQALAHAQE